MRLPRFLSAIAAGALLLSAVTACTGKNAVDQSAGSQFRFVSGTTVGHTIDAANRKKVGDFTGELLDGSKLSLSQDAGKIVVINYWATWCGPCKIETPQFDSVYRTNKAKSVEFVGVDTKDIRSQAQSFVKDNDISYPIVFDEPGKTALRLGKIPSTALPFTVILDKQHRVAAVYLHALTPKDLQPVLDKLLAEA